MSVLAWQDPPERRNLVLDSETVAELRSRPGEWALIRRQPGHRSPTFKHPVDVEVRCHYVGGRGDVKVTEIYVRCKSYREGQ